MLIKIKVKTGKPVFMIDKRTSNEWLVNLTSQPEDNKANLELIKELTKLGYAVRILRGSKSKEKLVELT